MTQIRLSMNKEINEALETIKKKQYPALSYSEILKVLISKAYINSLTKKENVDWTDNANFISEVDKRIDKINSGEENLTSLEDFDKEFNMNKQDV